MKRIHILLFLVTLSCGLFAQSQQPYLVADFNEKDLPALLDICHRSGIGILYEKNPFSTCGHYEWNKAFAPEGEASVRRMVKTAENKGITLGLMVQEDVISTNDAYYAQKYFNQYLHSDPLEFFIDVTPEEVEMAVRRNAFFKSPSTLNLLMIDNEIVSYGTMEHTVNLVLLHNCSRGLFGTQKVAHDTTAKVYKIMETPDRCVIPDGELRDAVRRQLANRLSSGNVTQVLNKDAGGQEFIDESIRVRQVEHWEEKGIENNTLGWLFIHAADKRKAATSMEDLEWILSKAAGFRACYGLVVEPKAMKEHGMLNELLATMNRWNQLLRADVLTEQQRQKLRDPYLDWHLEQQDSDHYLLYPMNFSRRYQCTLEETDPGVLRSETWTWNADEVGRFGLRLKVDGEREIINPMVNTARGLVMFPCSIKPGQRLLYDFGETALLVDANDKILSEITIEGLPELDEGSNEVYFICEVAPEGEQLPVVTLRYITREQPETVTLGITPNK